jgi:hypothetical protein
MQGGNELIEDTGLLVTFSIEECDVETVFGRLEIRRWTWL